MVRLSEDSKKKIEQYVKQGLLSQDLVLDIWRDTPKNRIIKNLKSHLTINEITLTKVWLYIIQNVWKDIHSMFEKREIILLKTILINDGVVLRSKMSSHSLNEYMVTRAIESLYERGVVDVLSFSKNEKIIILHPQFRHEVFEGGTN